MKTSRLGSMRPWRVFHRLRLPATSGRFCSLASTVFFEAEAFAADKCPDGAVVDPQPAPGKFGHQSAQVNAAAALTAALPVNTRRETVVYSTRAANYETAARLPSKRIVAIFSHIVLCA